MDSRLMLPKDTLLDGGYRITRVLGAGGFGITYEAEDVNLGTSVALKEYYPFDFGDRDATMSVRPKSERHKSTFDWGRSSFLNEARMLARFDHPSIVRVTRVFEANSTAYMVMRLEQGQSFEAWLGSLGRPPTQAELDRIVMPLLDALEIMHGQNFLHRDIAPDNIIVRANGAPVLLDFGAARRAVGEMSRMLTGIVKAGYSPPEQYANDGRLQGPWSDLYALGGVIYRAIAGQPPEEATLRAIDDRMLPAARAAKGDYRPSFLKAIDACLTVKHPDRPQTVADLRRMLQDDGPQAKAGPQPAIAAGNPRIDASASPGRTERSARAAAKRWAVIAAILALAGGAYGGFEYTRWSAEQDRKLAAEAKRRQDERAAAEKQAAEARERQETEAKRLADVAAARKKADDATLAKVHAEAKRLQQEAQVATEKRAAEERARQEAEAKRLADIAAARKKADDEVLAKVHAEARRLQQEAQVAAEKRAADERARSEAEERAKVQEARLAEESRATAEKTLQATVADHAYQTGERYLYGRGVPRDPVKAREAYEKAVAADHIGAMVGLGYIYENGLGVPKDHAKARQLYEKAAATGNAGAMNNLGRLYRNGWGVPRDYAKARDLFEKAAAAGNSAGMFNLGWLHHNGWGVPRDYGKAREWYEKAAAAGNGQAMASIGWLYRDGLGAARDYGMARQWFEKSVAARHGAGMHGLGVLHEAGQGVPKDLAKARDWFEKSAATGYDFGMNALGSLYQTAPVADYAKAREWYEKAVVTSNRLALRNLAVLLDQGQGGPSDPARAARLLLEAAKLNNAAAIEDLRGSMAKWSAKTRDELKRELAGRGHYKGPLNDAWDKDARAAADKFLTTGG